MTYNHLRTSSLEQQYHFAAQMSQKHEILNPGEHDVLLGRGGGTNGHPGNVNFRDLIKLHKKRYLAATKMDKPKVAQEVVEIWSRMDPPGRFLIRSDDTKRGAGSVRDVGIIWIQVDEKEARKKASQCLRERTDDAREYLAHLHEEQDKQMEEGVSRVKEKIMQSIEIDVATPSSRGSSATAKVKNRRSSPIETNTTFHSPDRPRSFNTASMRRTSLPATALSLTDGVAGSGAPRIRMQDRRTSMPAGGHKLWSNHDITHDLLMANHREVMREAYTAVERSAGLSPSGLADVQMQIQMQQQLQAARASMLRATSIPPISNPMNYMNGMGMTFPQGNMQGFGLQQMNLNMSPQEYLRQQQRYLAEQQQHILREQERLVRQEHLLAQMARPAQPDGMPLGQAQGTRQGIEPPNPAPVFSELLMSQASGVTLSKTTHSMQSHGLESLQAEENISRTLDLPNETKSKNTEHVETGILNSSTSTTLKKTKSSFRSTPDDSKPEALSRQKKGEAAPTKGRPGEHHPGYRTTLETYIANNQSSLASLEVQDEAFELGGTVNGVEADEWIEEQLFDNSGDMSISQRGSLRRDRTVSRTKSNRSVDLMSLATGTLGSTSGGDQMSVAFSELDVDDESVEVDDLSKGEKDNSKRNNRRSMSILSIGTAMSELSDFDLGELEGF